MLPFELFWLFIINRIWYLLTTKTSHNIWSITKTMQVNCGQKRMSLSPHPVECNQNHVSVPEDRKSFNIYLTSLTNFSYIFNFYGNINLWILVKISQIWVLQWISLVKQSRNIIKLMYSRSWHLFFLVGFGLTIFCFSSDQLRINLDI